MEEQDFFEWKPTPEEEAQMKADYAAMVEAENKHWKEVSDHNNGIFNIIKEKLGEEYLQAVLDCLQESEAGGKVELVKKPSFEPQEEDWDMFDHIYVDQYVNGGMSGDDFAGWVYIPVYDNLYLKSHYNM